MRAGALALWRSAPWLHDSVVLAVVDPGVGTSRRPVAIEVAGSGTVLIGPDNGLLTPAANALGPLTSAVELHRPPRLRHLPSGLGSTFDARDLFGPVAALVATGERAVGEVGGAIDPSGLAGSGVPAPLPDGRGGLRCEVLWVDRFGNAELNARPGDVAHLGDRVRILTPMQSTPVQARVVRAFGDLGDGELGLVTDSYGLLALARDALPAAETLGVSEGDTVTIGPAADG